MDWIPAPDVEKDLKEVVKNIDFSHVVLENIICFRSFDSSSRAIARIWNLPRVWQLALKLPPHYVIEVISERYDKLSEDNKRRTLIHELMHIPKNFSGALVSHRGRYHSINNRTVEKIFRIFLEKIK